MVGGSQCVGLGGPLDHEGLKPGTVKLASAASVGLPKPQACGMRLLSSPAAMSRRTSSHWLKMTQRKGGGATRRLPPPAGGVAARIRSMTSRRRNASLGP